MPTDGLTAHFTLRSDVGTFNADGLEMLRIRVAEIPAIVELNQTSKTKVFAQALATNAAAPVAAAGQMVMHPIDTVKGLPAGVGRFFGRVGLGAQKIKEAATTPEEASAGEKAGQVATRTFHTTRDILGYEQERRGPAQKVHVDPYTTNAILAKQLDDFALVAFRAHVGVTTTMSVFIPGSIAITATRVVSTWVYDTPRTDLIVQNQKKLEEIGVPEESVRAFMRNKAFPLSVQTAFVEDLTRVSGVPGSKRHSGTGEHGRVGGSGAISRWLSGHVGPLSPVPDPSSQHYRARHGDRLGSRRRNHRAGRGRLRLVDQARFVFRQPARSRIAETR